MSRPRYELSFTVTARDAGPEDVTAMLARLAEIVGKDAIQVTAPAPVLAAFPTMRTRGALPPAVKAFRLLPPAEKRVAILEALHASGWVMPRAADRLGISRPTLTQWMLDLRIPKSPPDGDGS